MKSKPTEMSLVSGGMNAEEMKKVIGARCVCSSNSASWNIAYPGDNCQCNYGVDNMFANAKIAQT